MNCTEKSKMLKIGCRSFWGQWLLKSHPSFTMADSYIPVFQLLLITDQKRWAWTSTPGCLGCYSWLGGFSALPRRRQSRIREACWMGNSRPHSSLWWTGRSCGNPGPQWLGGARPVGSWASPKTLVLECLPIVVLLAKGPIPSNNLTNAFCSKLIMSLSFDFTSYTVK